jgi:hypothetical protein
MADRWPPSSDAELERLLTMLGREVAFPSTPALAGRVRERLDAAPRPVRRRRWPRVALAVAAALLLAAIVFAASPGLRTAVAGRLGLRGINIVQVSVLPSPVIATPERNPPPTATSPPGAPTVGPPSATPLPLGERLQLGERVSLAEARRRVDFPILVPAALGPPDAVYVVVQAATPVPNPTPTPPGGLVTLVYRPRPDLPQAAQTGVGLLLGEFRGHTDQVFITKLAGPNTRITLVTVDGAPGFWLAGQPHEFLYEDPNGAVRAQTLRLAGDTLIWPHGDVTLRLEANIDEAAALRLAASLR